MEEEYIYNLNRTSLRHVFHSEVTSKRNKSFEIIFRRYKNYPMCVINQVIKQVEHKHTQQNLVYKIAENNEPSVENKKHLLLLPYHGEKGNYVIKSLKKQIRKLLPENVKAQVTYTGTKLDACFNLKDQTKFEHKNDYIYHGKCPTEECSDNYIGDTKRRMSERISDHNGRDISSYLLKHAIESRHRNISGENIKIINNGLKITPWREE